jgi:hypothetical protein
MIDEFPSAEIGVNRCLDWFVLSVLGHVGDGKPDLAALMGGYSISLAHLDLGGTDSATRPLRLPNLPTLPIFVLELNGLIRD